MESEVHPKNKEKNREETQHSDINQSALVNIVLEQFKDQKARDALVLLLQSLKEQNQSEEIPGLDWFGVVDAIKDPIFLHDKQGRIIHANKAYISQADSVSVDVKGKPYWTLFPLQSESLSHCALCHRKNNNEDTILSASGEEVFRSRSFVVNNTMGNTVYCLHILENITKLTLIEKFRLENESRLRSITDATRDAIVMLNSSGRIVYWNPAAKDMLGYTRSEALGGLEFKKLAPEDKQQEFVDGFESLLNGTFDLLHTKLVEFDIQTKNGCVKPVEISMAQVEILDEWHLVAILRDITERKQSEEQLRKSEGRFRGLVETTSDWIWEVDENGIYTYVSPNCFELMGYRADELIGSTPFDFMAHDEAQRVRNLFAKIVENQVKFHNLKNTVLHKNGSHVVLETSGVPIFDDRSFKGYRGVDRDISARIESEQALQQSQHHFRAVVETAPIIIWAMDKDGIVTFSQGSGLKALGVEPDELVGQSVFELYADLPEILHHLTRALAGEIFTTVVQIGEIFFESRYKPLIMNGESTGVIGIALDVTKREKTQEIVRSQAQMLEQIHDAVIVMDLQGNITMWNKGAERLYEYSGLEAIGQHISLIYPNQDDRELLKTSIIAPVLKKGTHQVEVKNCSKSGTIVFVHLSMFLLKDRHDVVTGMIGYSKDITQRKQDEERILQLNQKLEQRVRERTSSLEMVNSHLARSEERWRATIASLTDGVVVADQEGCIVSVNPEAEAILGLTQNDLLHNHVHEVIHKKNSSWSENTESECPICIMMEQGLRYQSDDFAFVSSNGKSLDLSITVNSMISLNKHIGSVVAIHDISERKEVDRLKDELLSSVSHELRTPLTSLIGFVDLLCDREYPKEKQLKLLSIVRDEGQRLNHLIDDFLDIQRIHSGRQTYTYTQLDFSIILKDMMTLFSINENLCRFKLTLDDNLCTVTADENRIRQVLKNLISNAIKFSSAGGEIILGAKNTPQGIEVHVSDNGIGIAKENQDKLFSKFYRVENKGKIYRGTGLGLALVKEIVEYQGGHVWVTSSSGKGSTFFFFLPLQNPCDEKGGAE